VYFSTQRTDVIRIKELAGLEKLVYIVVDCAGITVAGYPLTSVRSWVPFFLGGSLRKTFCHPTVFNIGRFGCLPERFVGGEHNIKRYEA
jgi:hypothetical protein